jgi:CubicO group peptidase (beta-lactamase class C family)
MSPAHGNTLPQFEQVRKAFTENLESGEDLGAACAVAINGKLVVNLYGGWQDRKKETPWADDTLVCVYSSGKAVVALLMAMAVDQGLVDYDAPVTNYWPEFGSSGKESLTVAQIMSHQSGLCGFPEEMDPALWLDWDAICNKLTEMAPLWSPGTASGYHPQTYGFLAGEILRRATGKTVGTLIREWFEAPHDIQIFCGMTEAEQARASHMTKPTSAPKLGDINKFKKAAFLSRWASPGGVDRAAWAAAEIPAANMHADARSLARLMNTIATKGELEGTRLFGEDTFNALHQERVHNDDLVLPFNLSWAAGMMRNTNAVYGPVEATLGHSGFGGSCTFADPENGLSFAYVMNKMSPYLVGDPRSLKLIEAVYASL